MTVERARTATHERHRSSNLDDALAYRINRTTRLLRTQLNRTLKHPDLALSAEKWFVLARVAHGGVVRQVDLTDSDLDDAATTSRLVDALTEAGLVRRDVDPEDRRGRLVQLTERGHTLADSLQRRVVATRNAVFSGLDDDDLDTLESLLDRIDSNVRQLLELGE